MKMTGYTKLFGSIITSTIWREKNETRILWITMLALKNKAGIVEGSIPGLADMARLSLEDTTKALDSLRSPDPYSRTKEFEGRRIEDVEGGWLVLNHEKWRQKMSADERREYLRIKQREHRQRVNKSVNKSKQTSTLSTHTDADAYTDKEKKSTGDATQWIEELEKEEAYKGINIKTELGKAKQWASANHRVLTRRFFVNWLNRADKPLQVESVKPSSPKYQRPFRTPSEQEIKQASDIAKQEVEKLRSQLKK